MTGSRASSQPPPDTASPDSAKWAVEPSPRAKPAATNAASSAAFMTASTFCTRRPGPSPTRWTAVSTAMTAKATRDWGETLRVTTPRGAAAHGSVSAAAGRMRPRYAAKPTAPTAMAPLKPATNDVQPVRKAGSGPNASRR